MAVGRTGVVAIAFASATLLSSIITIAVPYATDPPHRSLETDVSLTVSSFVFALGAVGAAAQSWLAAAALTFLVFVFELAAFADLASRVSQANSNYGEKVYGFGPTFAFAIFTWLLSMPTMAFCFMASKSPAQAQAPAQAEPVKATAEAPQGIASV